MMSELKFRVLFQIYIIKEGEMKISSINKKTIFGIEMVIVFLLFMHNR